MEKMKEKQMEKTDMDMKCEMAEKRMADMKKKAMKPMPPKGH